MEARQVFHGDRRPADAGYLFCPWCAARLDAGGSAHPRVVSNILDSGLHTIVAVMAARPIAGEPCAGDDVDAPAWHRFGDRLPPMAFAADAHIIERYGAEPFVGAPVDPRCAAAPRG